MGRGGPGRLLLLALLPLFLTLHITPAAATTKSYLLIVSGPPASWSGLLDPLTKLYQILYVFEAINGIGLQIDDRFVPALKLLPGAQAVIEDRLHKLHTTYSWEFLGLEGSDGKASDLWENVAEFGKGVVIGNVDSGVWPTSDSFRADGMVAPTKWLGGCDASDDIDNAGCNGKLIGARVFSKGIQAQTSSKGGQMNQTVVNSPWDYMGHGSHTLSTAGGGFARPRAGSPWAHVASYKACYNEGCTSLDVLKAILTAVEEGVDVLSLSLGEPRAIDYAGDAIAIGTSLAISKGIVVVASAGNSGPQPATVTNVAPWILTVAASTMDRIFQVDVIFGATTIQGQSLSNSTLGNQEYEMISGENANFEDQSATDSAMCLPGSLDPSKVSNKIVVCTRGGGTISTGQVVKEAGGAGMVLCEGSGSDSSISAEPHVIPAAHCSYSQCREILDYLQSTTSPPVGQIKIREAKVGVTPSPMMADFSSRGPNTITPEILKPDITAPGVSVIAAYSQGVSPTGRSFDDRRVPYTVQSGTSMACPHVAGIAGLLKATYPNWSPSMIKSAIMTTATTGANDGSGIRDKMGTAATPFNYGSGHVNPVRALDPGLVYDTKPRDYANFICSLRPTSTEGLLPTSPPLPLSDLLIPLLLGADADPFECSQLGGVDGPENLNYPSIATTCLPVSGSVTVKRRVKNVGGGAPTYTASVTEPGGVRVTVQPSTLSFGGEIAEEEKDFTVMLEVHDAAVAADYVFGGIEWSDVDGGHRVWSPIVATTKCG
ncbi:hypothetical protein VPH35_025860 [Triticum aestivum]